MRRTTAFGKICATVDSTFSVPKPVINQRVLSAGGTFLWHGGGMAAQMTAQSPGDRRMPMKRERDAAIRTVARFAARRCKGARSKIRADSETGSSARVFRRRSVIACDSFSERIGSFLFLPSFLAQIDDAHERHLLFVHALGQRQQLDICRSPAL